MSEGSAVRPRRPSRTWLALTRVTSLLVPSAIAWRFAANAPASAVVDRATAWVVGPMWCVLLVSVGIRTVDAVVRHVRGPSSETTLLDRIDVLTASGAALSWLGAGAIVLATVVGWASLSVVGLLGLGVFHLVTLWTLWRTGGEDPWRTGSLTRRFTTERPVEGGPLVEEIRFAAPRIPIGFRLFARGRIGPRWATSRYVLEGRDDASEVRLETDVGPARRGDHQAEPMEVWLQDVFGLSRSRIFRAGEASVTVRPRSRTLRGASDIVRAHGGLEEPRAARRPPTEGSLHLREYQQGDDARRIHWPRSLSTGQTIVRTPDESPHDDKAVRIVLDTYMPGAEELTCPAPAELLDTLVALWMGVARAFAEAGHRVDLVVTAPGRAVVAPGLRGRRATMRAEELGARAAWQAASSVDTIPGRGTTVIVSYRHQPLASDAGPTLWVLAREWAWVSFDMRPPSPSLVLLPHPMGSPENSGRRRRRALREVWRARADHARFTRLCGDVAAAGGAAGTWLATPSLAGAIHVEKLS